MSQTPTRIPSFRALRCLAIALREGSISAAARELNITPGAVSRQLGALEEDLQQTLFVRHARGVSATAVGQRLADRLSAAFDDIQRAVIETRQLVEGKALTVNALPSLCIHWLMPILPDFQGQHPDIDLRIFTSGRPDRFDDNEIDVAVAIGPVEDDRFVSIPILGRYFTPVCSPMTLASYDEFKPEDLLTAPIFYSALQQISWRLWCDTAGIETVEMRKHGVRFENTSLAYQAARQGSGFVIGQKLLLHDELDIGRMVMPFDIVARSDVEYCLVFRRQDINNPMVRAFVEWVLEQARKMPEGIPDIKSPFD
ncbi:LysR substrate-binding domain-containing protein [uncultured Cohaesibacter sp.]|uniref:LysR substrate-binding domain-containing protein n=1 Tax=uncultured Cohaesibacter sp. TaxID=1002546 RepID=UPI0029C78C4E|nr:LysR substrate-binding domain-containing protein [uncultured Cohaesibacter sp.]